MCQLDWAIVPKYLIKCYSGYFCEGVFSMRLTYKSVDFEQGKLLYNMSRPPAIKGRS